MNNSNDNEEIQLFYIQIVATIAFIGMLLVSIVLSYNEILKLEHKKTILSRKQERDYVVIDREGLLFIAIIYFYINSKNVEIAQMKGKNTKGLEYQKFAALIVIIASVISLYSTLFLENDISELENPEL